MNKLLRFSAVALILALCLLSITPPKQAQAIAQPDSLPRVNAVYVYSFADNSTGVLVDYHLDYAVLPAETATQAYWVAFIDTDGTTQLNAAAPYTFVDSGYGYGLVWMFFTAAQTAAYNLNSANIALYTVRLMGNPTVPSGWTGAPPVTTATIDQWNTTGDMAVQLAYRILYYANVLELAWSLDLIQNTSIGNRLTTTGSSYFANVITNLQTLAPACFANATRGPTPYISIDYDTGFGATATSGTANVTGSPVTLSSGANTITTGATTGTIILDLAQWTSGNITNGAGGGGGTVTGSPVTLKPGVNTVTVTAGGTFTVIVAEASTITLREAAVSGTGLDLTTSATPFGLSRWAWSTIVWLLLGFVVCAALYGAARPGDGIADDGSGAKVIMVLFGLWLLTGQLLGLVHPIVAALIFIAYMAFVGYILFLRSEALHKNFMYMLWMFFAVSLAGNLTANSLVGITTTHLSGGITATNSSNITVASTAGFPESGTIVIGDEQISYPTKDSTSFLNTTVLGIEINGIVRGAYGTGAVAHSSGDAVRTKESWMLNASIDYKIAQVTDTAGLVDYLALAPRLLDLLRTFFTLPLSFLGTELAVLGYIWIIIVVGVVIGFVTSLLGGRAAT